MTKIPVRPNSLNQLQKNLLPKTKNSSTPSPRPAPLARKLLFAIFWPPLFFFFWFPCIHFAAILTELTREKKTKNPKLMGQLLRAPPTRWFFPKNNVLLRKLRLPRSITQKRQLLCPAPEHQSRRKLGPGLAAHGNLLLGVPRLLSLRM